MEGAFGAVEGRLDVAQVAKEIAGEVVLRVVDEGEKGEGEPGVGVFFHGLFGVVALLVEVLDDLLEGEFVEADLDLLGAHETPGLGGELGDEEGLVGGLGSEVFEEALLEG